MNNKVEMHLSDTVTSWAENSSSGVSLENGDFGTISSMGFAIEHLSGHPPEHSTLGIGTSCRLGTGNGTEDHLSIQLQNAPTATDFKLKAEPSPEPEDKETGGHEKLINLKLRSNTTLVHTQHPMDYLIRARNGNIFMSQLGDRKLVMEKRSPQQLSKSVFRVRTHLDKKSNQFVCSIFHPHSQSYVHVSKRRSVSLLGITETSEPLGSIGRHVSDGRHSETMTVDLSSSIRLPSPESSPAEREVIPKNCLFKYFNPGRDLVSLAPMAYPDESLYYEERDGKIFVVLANKSGKNFSCEIMSAKGWGQIKAILPIILQNHSRM